MTDLPRVKVAFDLPQEPGRPSSGREHLWATPLPDSEDVRLDNIPFFVDGVALGDVFSVRVGEDGYLYAAEKVAWSGACTIRLVVLDDGPLAGDVTRALDLLAPLFVEGEAAEQYRMLALTVPPEADLAAVKNLLIDGVVDGWWEYEEACVGDAWRAAE
ncbi:DUF4265 domain-containing protein [Kutzneria buriramensis]|uniref:Uncharacterized protein DUF4265 n=1 Tax=Kutzneria buriramensis TaxID=1045776 RepID=A0A3E0H202_9PSEU|nr:DUF4265 domain-containing protein [Kutzneria buriramensis]REH36294.1 uncharacterized protein DUF4265 [Kutzneria buriramensis]